jgi:hypothetical protein
MSVPLSLLWQHYGAVSENRPLRRGHAPGTRDSALCVAGIILHISMSVWTREVLLKYVNMQ